MERRLKDAYMDSDLQQSPAFAELPVVEGQNNTALAVKCTDKDHISKVQKQSMMPNLSTRVKS